MPDFRFPEQNHFLIAISDRVWIRLSSVDQTLVAQRDT